jgi:hypothetical protein
VLKYAVIEDGGFPVVTSLPVVGGTFDTYDQAMYEATKQALALAVSKNFVNELMCNNRGEHCTYTYGQYYEKKLKRLEMSISRV